MFIIFENGKEHESTGGNPWQIFPKSYADRFRPMELDESILDTPEAQYQNCIYEYEDLGDKVKKTAKLVAKTADEQRLQRNILLGSTDSTQVDGFPNKDKWATYRQELRDLPTHANWPDLKNEDWPTLDLN